MADKRKCLLLTITVVATFVIIFSYMVSSSVDFISPNVRSTVFKPSKLLQSFNLMTKSELLAFPRQLLNSRKDAPVYYSMCKNIKSYRVMSSPKYSLLELVNTDLDVIVRITAMDQNNARQTKGGDIVFVWAESTSGHRVAGEVTDNEDGTYTGVVKIPWTGKAVIRAKIAATIENGCLKQNSRDNFGNAVYSMQKPWGILGTYQRNGLKERTRCGANPLIYGHPRLCNFTDINDGMPWYCGPPQHPSLSCTDITSFGTGPFVHPANVTDADKMTIPGHGVIQATVVVEVTKPREMHGLINCSLRPKSASWNEPIPSGYWTQGKWTMTNCIGLSNHSSDNYRKCFKNKLIVIMGDSTIRNYAEYILENVLNLRNINLKDGLGLGHTRTYHNRHVFSANNVSMTYRKHAMPFHNPDFPPNSIVSIPHEILSIESWPQSGESLILLLHFNVHFQAYPSEQFQIRIKRAAEAVKHLLSIKPGIRVLIKGPQVALDDARWYDPHMSLKYRDILMEEFHDIRDSVVYLDVWIISITHNYDDAHPRGDPFNSQIHQLMSYLCSS